MTPERLLKNFSDLYAFSFWKVCHPVRLLKTARLLETSEYLQYLNNFNFYSSLILIVHLFGLTVSLTTKCW